MTADVNGYPYSVERSETRGDLGFGNTPPPLLVATWAEAQAALWSRPGSEIWELDTAGNHAGTAPAAALADVRGAMTGQGLRYSGPPPGYVPRTTPHPAVARKGQHL